MNMKRLIDSGLEQVSSMLMRMGELALLMCLQW